jgi:hypothetical protein
MKERNSSTKLHNKFSFQTQESRKKETHMPVILPSCLVLSQCLVGVGLGFWGEVFFLQKKERNIRKDEYYNLKILSQNLSLSIFRAFAIPIWEALFSEKQLGY